jgi:hypothetical protein
LRIQTVGYDQLVQVRMICERVSKQPRLGLFWFIAKDRNASRFAAFSRPLVEVPEIGDFQKLNESHADAWPEPNSDQAFAAPRRPLCAIKSGHGLTAHSLPRKHGANPHGGRQRPTLPTADLFSDHGYAVLRSQRSTQSP